MTSIADPSLAPARLEAAVALHFAVPVHVAVAASGAAALARALAAAGRATEPTPSWPCPYASLSHCGDVAVAVALPPAIAATGVGIDLEFARPIRRGFARMICTAHELAWLDTVAADERDAEVLRLWTVKEALYKADPDQGDAIVAHYAVASPGSARTTGARVDGGEPSKVLSLAVSGGVLSMALRVQERGVPS